MPFDFKGMAKGLSDQIRNSGALATQKFLEGNSAKPEAKASPDVDTANSMSQVLLGPIGAIGDHYFPVELIGGCCPRVIGEEAEIVWNAAAEASDSERVHVVWQSMGDKIWFLAVRSAELASHPNTWCPFAALLHGMKDAAPLPACYTYYTDEAATMMTISADGLQIHRGTASVVRAKAERTVREMGGDVHVIELTPEKIQSLTPVPWYSISLFEDRARRILASFSVIGALGLAGAALIVWFIATVAMISAEANHKTITTRAQESSVKLLSAVQGMRASPMREQLAKFAELNDGLLALNGWLEIYQIKSGKTLWRALVPPNVTSERISELGGQNLDSSAKGVVIGNSRESLGLGGR